MHWYYIATSWPFKKCKFAFKTAVFLLKTNLTSEQLKNKNMEREESTITMFKEKKISLHSMCFHMIALKAKHSLHSVLQGQEVAYKYASPLLSEPIISLPQLRGNIFVSVWLSPSVPESLLWAQTGGRTAPWPLNKGSKSVCTTNAVALQHSACPKSRLTCPHSSNTCLK